MPSSIAKYLEELQQCIRKTCGMLVTTKNLSHLTLKSQLETRKRSSMSSYTIVAWVVVTIEGFCQGLKGKTFKKDFQESKDERKMAGKPGQGSRMCVIECHGQVY